MHGVVRMTCVLLKGWDGRGDRDSRAERRTFFSQNAIVRWRRGGDLATNLLIGGDLDYIQWELKKSKKNVYPYVLQGLWVRSIASQIMAIQETHQFLTPRAAEEVMIGRMAPSISSMEGAQRSTF